MFGKVVVQGISGLLLLSAASMFIIGAQAGAFKQPSANPAPLIASAQAAPQSAPLELF